VAILNTTLWGILVPPFEVPDENAHVAYVQYLAETGRLPSAAPGQPPYSPEINATLDAVGFPAIPGHPNNRVPPRETQRRALQALRQGAPSRVGSGDATSATNNPPLYYALEAAVYRASPTTDLLTRLALMRILSALLAGATALFAALFVRELLPGTAWAWTAAGLVVALQPLFGFISSGVNNDALLYCASAAMFFGLARMLRRGVTTKRALFVGLAFSGGVLAKATMIAFAPAVGLAFVLVIAQARPGTRRAATRAVAYGIAAVGVPVIAYALASKFAWDRPVWGAGFAPAATGEKAPLIADAGSIREAISYVWQLFLPKLGVLTTLHPTPDPPRTIWFDGFVGQFGWLDYGFPVWVYDVASSVALAVIALAGTTLIRRLPAVAHRRCELVTFALAAVGLMVVIGLAGYQYWLVSGHQRFEQARYLLPLLPLYGAVVALALRASRRAGPTLAVCAVVIATGWSVYAQILTVLRYHG